MRPEPKPTFPTGSAGALAVADLLKGHVRQGPFRSFLRCRPARASSVSGATGAVQRNTRAEPTQRPTPLCIALALLVGAVPLSGCGAQPPQPQQKDEASLQSAAPPPAPAPELSDPTAVPAARFASASSRPEAPALPMPAPSPPPLPSHAPTPASPAAAARAVAARPDPMLALLAFADRMRGLPAAERARELAVANAEPAATASTRQLRHAIVLMQNRTPADLARAQQLAQQVAESLAADATPLKPLARLLVARLAEQRRLEDQLDKLNQQVREQQRRIDQLNQRLEAVRAIERSMTPPRPPANAVPLPN